MLVSDLNDCSRNFTAIRDPSSDQVIGYRDPNQGLNFGWFFLGAGSFNFAFRACLLNREGSWRPLDIVLKIPKAEFIPFHLMNSDGQAVDELDRPGRAVRLWNEINPRLVAKEYGRGWVAPYVGGRDLSEEEVITTIIDLYKRTGRILVDALTPGNLKSTPDGRIVCVDVGYALKLYSINTDDLDFSVASTESWDCMREQFTPYFAYLNNKYPAAVKTIKALLILRYFKSDFREVALLQQNSFLRLALSQLYDDWTADHRLRVQPDSKTQIQREYQEHVNRILAPYITTAPVSSAAAAAGMYRQPSGGAAAANHSPDQQQEEPSSMMML